MTIPRYVIEDALKQWPEIDITQLRCGCADCPQNTACELAWDLYNCYTEDGSVIDTGCLCEK